MKKKYLFLLGFFIPTLVLSSCKLIGFVGQDSYSPGPLGDYAGQTIELKDVSYNQSVINLPNKGNQKILVLPICFNDYTLDKLNLNENDVINNLNKTFFGETNETGFESVSSFYTKSSYGKLNISGEVANVFTLNKSLMEILQSNSSEKTYYIVNEAVKNYKTLNPNKDLSEFDTNKDGYLDSVWVVYMNPYFGKKSLSQYIKWDNRFQNDKIKSKASDLLWAYTYWNYDNKKSLSSPNAYAYSWASYDFILEGNYKDDNDNLLVDAHTFIHETGHLLGLDDYYSYDSSLTGTISPCGGIDMMDNNIGDHNSYSKYLLNWVEPYIIKDKGEYHLLPFQDGGNCFIIPGDISTYNNSPFDEYLLIELYTPTGLNYIDSLSTYASTNMQCFTDIGVKVYHIDSRLGKMQQNIRGDYVYSGISHTNFSSVYGYTKIAANNTPSYSENGYMLCSLLTPQKNSSNSYYYIDRSDGSATNNDLYKENDSIKSFKFNSGSSLGYKISFKNLTSSGVDIVIE